MSADGPATTPCNELRSVEATAPETSERLELTAFDDADTDILLETMLAKAERLAHELQDTCSSAATASRGYAEYPGSFVKDLHLPEAIEMKDHATECSSIGNGVSVSQTPLFGHMEREIREDHRFVASPEDALLVAAVEGVHNDSVLPHELPATRIDAVPVPAESDGRISDDMQAPIPALLSPPVAHVMSRSQGKADVATVSAGADNTATVSIAKPLPSLAAKHVAECSSHLQSNTRADSGKSNNEQRAILQWGKNHYGAPEEQKEELGAPTCRTDSIDGIAVQAAQNIVSSTLNSTVSNVTILSVSTSSKSVEETSVLNVEASQRQFEHADEQKVESPQMQQTLSTQVTPLSSNKTSPWEATSFVTEADEDYAPVADYSNSIKWERVTSARQGDDDYVPLSDYSSPTNALYVQSRGTDRLEMTYSRHRAAIRRRRKQRRRRLVIFVAVVAVTMGGLLLRALYGRVKVAQTIQRRGLVAPAAPEPGIVSPVAVDETVAADLDPLIEERMDKDEGIGDTIEPIENAIVLFDSSILPETGQHPLTILTHLPFWNAPSRQQRRVLVEDLIACMME